MLPGLVLGLLGLAFGVGAAVLSSPVLGVAAGACALGAAGTALAAMRRVQEAEREATSAIDAVTLRHLELFTAAGNRSVVDVETGLPDQRFFELALDGRVAAWPGRAPPSPITASVPSKWPKRTSRRFRHTQR